MVRVTLQLFPGHLHAVNGVRSVRIAQCAHLDEHACQRRILADTDPAMHLHRLVDTFQSDLRRGDLDHGNVWRGGAVIARIHHGGGFQAE